MMFLADHYILEQINAPEDVSSNVYKERGNKTVRPRYEPTTGEFLGLYETTGFIAVRGDADEHVLSYG